MPFILLLSYDRNLHYFTSCYDVLPHYNIFKYHFTTLYEHINYHFLFYINVILFANCTIYYDIVTLFHYHFASYHCCTILSNCTSKCYLLHSIIEMSPKM